MLGWNAAQAFEFETRRLGLLGLLGAPATSDCNSATISSVECPKCAFANPRGAIDCGRCGVVFAKFDDESREPVFRPVRAEVEEKVLDGRVGATEMKILGAGLAAAIVVYAIPLTRFIASLIVTLFHEFGHAVMGWLLGYASIPAFDFVYGGGFTHHGPFRLSIAIAVAAIFAWLGWTFRENRKSTIIIGSIFLVWLFIVTKEWRREIAFASAGHLAEFILAGIMFYKALSGVGWRIPEVERPLGAFVAFFVQIHSMLFAWKLIRDPAFMEWYRGGKDGGGGFMNDLEVVALDFKIYVGWMIEIETVARWLLLFSFVPIVVGLIWYFERARWHRVLRSLRTVDA
jgi:hypothetical protein